MGVRLRSVKKLVAPVILLMIARLAASEPHLRPFRLTLHAPHAKVVEVAGDFIGWQNGRTPMHGPTEAGMWWIDLDLPHSVRRIEYVHWVDGQPGVTDPRQPVVEDGFGGSNNVLVLP